MKSLLVITISLKNYYSLSRLEILYKMLQESCSRIKRIVEEQEVETVLLIDEAGACQGQGARGAFHVRLRLSRISNPIVTQS